MGQRLHHIDLLKLVAANLLVLHHLASYGPISDALMPAAPSLMGWLFEYARMAVQVFLVIGGYLAVKGIGFRYHQSFAAILRQIAKRYLRLVLPYLTALVLAMLAALLARQWLQGNWIPGAPTAAQLMAHIFLLQGLLGFDSLSIGVWYIAIDFQLFALLTLLIWLGTRNPNLPIAEGLVILVSLASLFYFNRDAAWDNWALYFFGTYGLGAMTYWVGERQHSRSWQIAMLIVVIAALVLDFRTRLMVAMVTAALLSSAHQQRVSFPSWSDSLMRIVSALGQQSYSLFLVHFPVCLLGNAILAKLGLTTTGAASAGFLVCWAASLGAAYLFYRFVELPLRRQ